MCYLARLGYNDLCPLDSNDPTITMMMAMMMVMRVVMVVVMMVKMSVGMVVMVVMERRVRPRMAIGWHSGGVTLEWPSNDHQTALRRPSNGLGTTIG